MPALRWRSILAGAVGPAAVPAVWTPNLGDGGDDLPGHAQAAGGLVSRHVLVATQKNGASALGLQRVLGLGSYKTAWTWLHKLRRAMVRPGRDRLAGGWKWTKPIWAAWRRECEADRRSASP